MSLVEAYNSDWPLWFQRLQVFLHDALGDSQQAIEHIGSTSVPGMTAKPIIDIDVVRARDFEEVRQRLEAIGYEYEGDKGIPGREAFRVAGEKLKAWAPPHHLYVLAPDAEELSRHRAFRDFLRESPSWVQKLSAQKRSLAGLVAGDRDKYQEAKAPMVEEVLRIATRGRTS